MRLSDLASAVRTKNAGPCLLTIDMLFPDAESFHLVAKMREALRSYVRAHYGVPDTELMLYIYAPAHAIKLTLPREAISGSFSDRDVYGAQQHKPILDFEI